MLWVHQLKAIILIAVGASVVFVSYIHMSRWGVLVGAFVLWTGERLHRLQRRNRPM